MSELKNTYGQLNGNELFQLAMNIWIDMNFFEHFPKLLHSKLGRCQTGNLNNLFYKVILGVGC